MGSPMEWGAKVLFGERRERIHGPAETYAVRSFTSKARGNRMIDEWVHERDPKYDNRDLRQGWVYSYSAEDRELRFWVLTKHAKAVMEILPTMRWIRLAGVGGYRKSWAETVEIQTERVHERWTEICLRGRW